MTIRNPGRVFQSVFGALIGASVRQGAVGSTVWRNLLAAGLPDGSGRSIRNMPNSAACGAITESPNEAVRSFAHRRNHAKAEEALMRTPPSLPKDFSVNVVAAKLATADAKAAGRSLLTETEAKHVLAAMASASRAPKSRGIPPKFEPLPSACCSTRMRSR
jgi:acyl-CoA synthetase (NDP forming)